MRFISLLGISGAGSSKEEEMRIGRTVGLAFAVAVAASAIAGASSAMATTTELCKVHQEPCQAANHWTEIHVVSVGKASIITSIANVECNALFKAMLLALASPQIAHETANVWTECAIKEGSACKVTQTALGLYRLLKTVLNLGTVATAGRRAKVECGAFMNCEYGEEETETPIGTIEGAGHQAGSGHGMFNIGPMPLKKIGGFLCPATAEFRALYEPLADFFVVA